MTAAKNDPAVWLNQQLFQKALVQHTADRSLEVEDVHLAVHGNAAQQFSSTVYQASVSYRSRGKPDTIKLIVKLVASKVSSIVDESSFDAELSVYRKFVPKMEETTAVSETGAKKFAPKLIYAANEPHPYIILEDLTSQQYEHNKTLLGLEDATAVLRKLAQFHATSYCLSKTTSSNDKGNNGLFTQKPSEGVKFMQENFELFTEELSTWDGYGKYAERLRHIQATFIERGVNIFQASKDGFGTKVLNHGDFNYNNMLFKFDTDRHVADVIFCDYQLSCWTTPAVDLLYFLYLICDRETRDTKRAELLQLYHEEFTSTLSSGGFMGNGPTLHELHCDLLRAGFLEVAIAVCFVPFLCADPHEAIGDGGDALAYRRQLYNREEYQAIIKPLLRNFLHKGFLD